jgi:formylglycine-generating enzyme required for sulfatase activity
MLAATKPRPSEETSTAAMACVPGGTFLMGSSSHPEEAPAHRVSVNGFWIDRRAVTDSDSRRFIDATDHVVHVPSLTTTHRRCKWLSKNSRSHEHAAAHERVDRRRGTAAWTLTSTKHVPWSSS